MALSRPVLLALLGLVLATATLFAARGANQNAAEPVSNAVPPPAATALAPGKANKADDAKPRSEARDKSAKKGSKPAGPAARATTPLPAGVPVDVGRALRDRKVVVLFFGQGGADDVATAEAVASLRGLGRVAVFRDGIQNLGKYPGIVSGLGVAQAPAVVIVGAKRRAALIEGFIDSGTLRQQVVDAR